jgi:L-alanine-DL-glutamate epimerase-like enolase superfamily enzyme
VKIRNIGATSFVERSISAGRGSPLLVEVETDEGLIGIGEACVERMNALWPFEK